MWSFLLVMINFSQKDHVLSPLLWFVWFCIVFKEYGYLQPGNVEVCRDACCVLCLSETSRQAMQPPPSSCTADQSRQKEDTLLCFQANTWSEGLVQQFHSSAQLQRRAAIQRLTYNWIVVFLTLYFSIPLFFFSWAHMTRAKKHLFSRAQFVHTNQMSSTFCSDPGPGP